MIRTRFAPSPTGNFHVGGARTALFNYLFARQNDGQFILRIEDTDQKRYDPNAVLQLYSGLNYLGLSPDEGPDKEGPYGPYIQTKRLEIYERFCDMLVSKSLAYRVFTNPEIKKYSQEELRKMDWKERSQLMELYRWRNANSVIVKKMVESGIENHVRLKLPRQGNIIVQDKIRGEISFQWNKQKDPVIMKTDGIPTYHFANVIDDHLMRISHVIRGEEWLSSMPIHWFLYDCLNFQKPEFVHLPLILNPVGKGKLSKRKTVDHTGADIPVFVEEYQEAGYLPEAMVNYLALLGWNNGDDREFFNKEKLIDLFSLERVSRSSSKWDLDKLNNLQRRHMQSLSPEEFASRAGKFFNTSESMLSKFKTLLQPRITGLGEIRDWLSFLNNNGDRPPLELLTQSVGISEALDILHLSLEYKDVKKLEKQLRRYAKKKGLKAGQVFWPLRIAVTGQEVAPPLFETMEILGQKKCKSRIKIGISVLEEQHM